MTTLIQTTKMILAVMMVLAAAVVLAVGAVAAHQLMIVKMRLMALLPVSQI
jgi:hypothetical protein